ncbi:hypothetical protein [Flavobacterium wongokense]|uniref:hypothetical protein n=1 Tax=Flavobacterium wongokense TaxID=2910674 RepID=UPI001F429795|nr:hypothetical protein [Flavobacterium sp. WG47]MCF6133213.1 hypothetical protein [Flavobacterium sp. WG47]
MISQTQSTPGRFSTYLAVTSFVIGTLFLIWHLSYPDNEIIIFLGCWFVLAALTVNGITFLYLIYLLIIRPLDRETLFIRILILLSNIPIFFLYTHIVINNISLLTQNN